jgi:hypothetical protein
MNNANGCIDRLESGLKREAEDAAYVEDYNDLCYHPSISSLTRSMKRLDNLTSIYISNHHTKPLPVTKHSM